MNGKVFIGEFGRRWIKTVTVTAGGGLGTIEPFPAYTGTQVMDMEFGPDGALYVLDYGTGWFGGDANSARVPDRVQLRRRAGRRSPVANANPTSGQRAADRAVQLGRDQRPGRQPDHVRVGLHDQRQHRLDRGQPVVHLHRQRRVHGDADGAATTPAAAPRRASSSASADRRSRSTCRSTGGCSTSATRSRSRSPSPIRTPRPSTARGCGSTTSWATTVTATRSPAPPAARAPSRPLWTVSTTPTRTSSVCSPPSTPRSARPRRSRRRRPCCSRGPARPSTTAASRA